MFCSYRQVYSKILWKSKGTRLTKVILRKRRATWKESETSDKNQSTWIQELLHSFNNQDSMVINRETHIDQENKIENPEIDQHKYAQMIF